MARRDIGMCVSFELRARGRSVRPAVQFGSSRKQQQPTSSTRALEGLNIVSRDIQVFSSCVRISCSFVCEVLVCEVLE